MIIDSKRYSGKCKCGRTHEMTTEFCVIERGCLSRFEEYVKKYGLSGVSVAIYDENTHTAVGNRHPRADFEIVLPTDDLHANEHWVEIVLSALPEKADYLIALGSGTIHDITRYCAYTRGIPFVSCPTAASVDGFCSSVAAMTWYGYKKTLTAVAPRLVIADLDIISSAPKKLALSGFGDMIGKYIALADWRIAELLRGEYMCPEIYSMTVNAVNAVTESCEGIITGDTETYEKLMYGLILSGIAMQLLGTSRCASGAEHHISHFIEVRPTILKGSSDALHGEKVGVGTLIALKEYTDIVNKADISFGDYKTATDSLIERVFGEALFESVVKENESDACLGICGTEILESMTEIRRIISEIPSYEVLLQKYRSIGAMMTLADIGMSDDSLSDILDYSPLIRNRLTLMRLRRAMLT